MHHVSAVSECESDVFTQRPNIRPFRTGDRQCHARALDIEQIETANVNLPWFTGHNLSLSGQLVEPLAVLLDGRIHGGNLLDIAAKPL